MAGLDVRIVDLPSMRVAVSENLARMRESVGRHLLPGLKTHADGQQTLRAHECNLRSRFYNGDTRWH